MAWYTSVDYDCVCYWVSTQASFILMLEWKHIFDKNLWLDLLQLIMIAFIIGYA